MTAISHHIPAQPDTDMPVLARQAISSKMPSDREGVRQAMSWLHTWAGLLLGWLLFAIFFAGTLSFFKNEFNLWMRPEMHGLPPAEADVAQKSVDALRRKFPELTQWIMHLPDERNPAVGILWRDTGHGRFETLHMNPQTGEAIETRQTMGGDFFYRFHFELRTAQKGRWTLEGRWLVGVATMLMLVALITGVITHRRIFKDFFTFRPTKGGQRAWLDAHNISGILVLPFYLMITFSGLMIFHTMYMPAGIATVYQTGGGVDANAYFAELQGENPVSRPPRGAQVKVEPLPAIALQPIMDAAIAHWQGGRIGSLQARRDAQGRAVVEVTRHEGDRLQYRPPRLVFNATTVQRLDHADPSSPAAKTYGVLYGLHLARFADTGMRWALFGFGMLGSLMIATGLVLWSVKRSAKSQASKVPFGQRLVIGMNMATLAGLPLACGVYLTANRLLPLDIKGRADVELAWFFGAWGLVWLWGGACILWRRPSRMGWSVPLGAAGLVWVVLPLLNALTTHTHLGVTLPAHEWMWASMDLSFLAAGIALGWLSWRLRPGRAVQGKARANGPVRAAVAPPSAQAASTRRA